MCVHVDFSSTLVKSMTNGQMVVLAVVYCLRVQFKRESVISTNKRLLIMILPVVTLYISWGSIWIIIADN